GVDRAGCRWWEREGEIDQRTPGFCQLARLSHEPALQGCERGDVGRALKPGDVGMAADGPRRRAGGIEEDGVERPCPPLREIDGDRFRGETEALEVLPQPFEPSRRAVDSDDGGAAGRELSGLAPSPR